MKVLAAQSILKEEKVDFFGNDSWPGSSPDLNVVENLGAIIKDRVEEQLRGMKKVDIDTLREKMKLILREMEYETDMFVSLLSVYPERLRAVIAANGKAKKYWLCIKKKL